MPAQLTRWLDELDETGRWALLKLVTGALRIGAVSYTHLRAHETVLDLVCRLLLEKQKQYILKQASIKQNNNKKSI